MVGVRREHRLEQPHDAVRHHQHPLCSDIILVSATKVLEVPMKELPALTYYIIKFKPFGVIVIKEFFYSAR